MWLLRVLPFLVLAYFGWHAFSGNRSIPRAITLHKEVKSLEQKVARLKAQTEILDAKVATLREESLDMDTLDLQVRNMLGLAREDELHVQLCDSEEEC